jgi:hypothetical protein
MKIGRVYFSDLTFSSLVMMDEAGRLTKAAKEH